MLIQRDADHWVRQQLDTSGISPVEPPRSWFYDKPGWFQDGTQKIEVDDDGRAAGYFFQWGDCLLNGDEDECWTPPPSETGYELFHQGNVRTAEGETVKAGVIGGGGEHAPVQHAVQQAALYYSDVTKQKMVGRLHEDEYGGYFLGQVLPDATRGDIAMINRSSLSGDWRYYSKVKDYDCLGPWLVTRPGLPLDRRGFAVDTDRSGFVRVASAQHGDLHPVYLSSLGGNMTTSTTAAPRLIEYQGASYRRIDKPGPKRAAADDVIPMDDAPAEEPSGDDSRIAAIESRLDALEAEVANMMGREEDGAEVVALDMPVL